MAFFGMLDIPLWLILLLPVCVLLFIYSISPYKEWEKLGVVGPSPNPFVGHMARVLIFGFCNCFERWQKEYGRIYGLYCFRRPVLVVTDLEALKQIFVKDFNSYVDRFFPGDGILTRTILKKGIIFEDGLKWQRLRRIMTPTFSSGKLKLFIHRMNHISKTLAERLALNAKEGVQTETRRVFGAFAVDFIAGTAFGLELDSQNNPDGRFVTEVKKLMTFSKRAILVIGMAEIFPALAPFLRLFNVGLTDSEPLNYFKTQMYSYVKDRKAHPEQYKEIDFMQLLVDAETEMEREENNIESSRLTLEEIAAQGIIFIIAGYETSSATLQFITYELARHPEVQEKLLAEFDKVCDADKEPSYDNLQNLKYTEAVINEALRMYPPLHLITRNTTRDTELKGIRIPASTLIYIPAYNIGRDPHYFEDPNTFNPDRFLAENKHKMDAVSFLPFGYGPRQCIGMRFAMLQMKTVLFHMLKKISIVDATPKKLKIKDFTGLLEPMEKVKLVLDSRI